MDGAKQAVYSIMCTRACDKSRNIAKENPVGHSSSVFNEMLMSNPTIGLALKWKMVQNNRSESRMNGFICIRSIHDMRIYFFNVEWFDRIRGLLA